MTRKPRILLIPNVAWWIIGEMGKQIIARFGDRYDFYLVPEGIFERRPELLEAFITAVDAIHCLNESSIELFREFAPEDLPPIATWIHHVTVWSAQHQLAVERSAAITVCTEGWRQDIQRRVPNAPPITVVPHGVDLSFFSRRDVPEGSFNIPAAKFVVGFVGSKGSDTDRGRKGLDTLFQVIQAAAQVLPDLHVVFAGPGWDGQLDGLRALGVSASATGYIRKSDLPLLYSALDTYLMTSRVEGGPCTVFEAMSCGTPVVATRVGAVPDLIVDGVNGYSAEVDDVEALTAGIVKLGQSPDARREIADRARAAISKLPWGTALAPLQSVYDHMIDCRPRSNAAGGPEWMKNPEEFSRTSSAADALASVIGRVRNGSVRPTQSLRLLSEMIDSGSMIDVIKGLAMLRGARYTTSAAVRSDSRQ